MCERERSDKLRACNISIRINKNIGIAAKSIHQTLGTSRPGPTNWVTVYFKHHTCIHRTMQPSKAIITRTVHRAKVYSQPLLVSPTRPNRSGEPKFRKASHWPTLYDVDLSLPALRDGVVGACRRLAGCCGDAGGCLGEPGGEVGGKVLVLNSRRPFIPPPAPNPIPASSTARATGWTGEGLAARNSINSAASPSSPVPAPELLRNGSESICATGVEGLNTSVASPARGESRADSCRRFLAGEGR